MIQPGKGIKGLWQVGKGANPGNPFAVHHNRRPVNKAIAVAAVRQCGDGCSCNDVATGHPTSLQYLLFNINM
jgi:hypothetical protein